MQAGYGIPGSGWTRVQATTYTLYLFLCSSNDSLIVEFSISFWLISRLLEQPPLNSSGSQFLVLDRGTVKRGVMLKHHCSVIYSKLPWRTHRWELGYPRHSFPCHALPWMKLSQNTRTSLENGTVRGHAEEFNTDIRYASVNTLRAAS